MLSLVCVYKYEFRSPGGQELRRPGVSGVQEAKNRLGGIQVVPRGRSGGQEARGWPAVDQEARRINSDKVGIFIDDFR